MTITKKRLQEIAKNNGWNRLDPMELDVQVDLEADEIAERSHDLADRMGKIENLEREKKEKASELGERIKEEETQANVVAKEIRVGTRTVEKECPGFFDPKSQERVYLDPDTEEEVYRVDAEQGDEQMKIA